jgi:hypothetical protein
LAFVIFCATHFTTARRERLQVLVVASGNEGRLRGVAGETDRFILAFPNHHSPALRNISEHSRAVSQLRRSGRRGARNLTM